MAKISKKKEDKFSWQSEEDIEFEKSVSIPNNLQEIVNNAPSGDQEKAKYLQSLLEDEVITIDEVNFLIDSGVLAEGI